MLIGLAVKSCFACHVLACLWVMVGRYGSLHGKDNWLSHQRCSDDDGDDDDERLACDWGPFTHVETTAGEHVGTIYLAAFYFCVTSMTSGGFGDITGRNDDERVVSVVLEFIGAGVLASCVASMTAVFTAQVASEIE